MLLDIIVISMVYFAYVVIFIGLIVIFVSFLNKLKHSRYEFDESYRPKVSFITPAYNEGKFIENTIKKYLKTTYPSRLKEMVIVNDGSTDMTRKIAERYASRIVDSETGKMKRIAGRKGNILLVNRKVGGKGKAYAMNDGLKHAKGEIFLITDGDIEIAPDIFEKALRHFADPEVGVVVGYASVKKQKGIMNDFIDYEFLSTQALHRRGYNFLGIHYIIPGGMSFFRREVFEVFGGYSARTLAEDTDLTFDILMNSRWKINYEMSAKVWSNEPKTLRGLWGQRVRWARGNLQVTWFHRRKVGKPRHGRAATIFYPFWIANMLMPIAFLLSTSGIFLSMLLGVQVPYFPLVKDLLLFSFFGVWLIVSLMHKFRSSFTGIISPGFPVLIGFMSFLFFDSGLVGFFNYMGAPLAGTVLTAVLALWLFIAVPGTYLCLRLSDKHERIAQFLQFGFFGYWMFLITAAFQAYVLELKGAKNIWDKTIK